MKMIRLSVGALVVISTSIVSPGISRAVRVGSAVTAFEQAASRLPDSAHIAGATLAQGRLVSAAGHPLGRATVGLAVEPPNEVLANMRVGDAYEDQFLSRATTRPDGTWTIRVASTLDLSDRAARGGDLNFAVLSVGTRWTAVGFFSRAIGPGPGQAAGGQSLTLRATRTTRSVTAAMETHPRSRLCETRLISD